MAIQKIHIDEFLQLAKTNLLLDVRSPGEYQHAHMPGAKSLPLFTDEERKVVGTAYKQQSRQTAIKIGLDYYGGKMRTMVETVEGLLANNKVKNKPGEENSELKNTVLVHCWRGGMRSAGVAWLLDLYGFKVYSLAGGYKKYREWARGQFEKDYALNIIGGYTGSGKTLVLEQLKSEGKAVIDLENIAHHKGSAFGALGEAPQPSQEMFENLLATELYEIAISTCQGFTEKSENVDERKIIYVEDESQRIGQINLPNSFWKQMRESPISFLNIPFEERLNFLTEEYGKFDKEKLVNAVMRIQKRLGGLETKNAINYLLENNHKECFRILLKYYDKWYDKGLRNRDNLPSLLHTIDCDVIDIKSLTNLLTSEKTTI